VLTSLDYLKRISFNVCLRVSILIRGPSLPVNCTVQPLVLRVGLSLGLDLAKVTRSN